MKTLLILLGASTLVLVLVALFLVGPFLLIWSFNTLFGLGLAYSGWNWLAGFALMVLLRGGSAGGSKS